MPAEVTTLSQDIPTVVDLRAVAADGWHERFLAGSPPFQQLAGIIGERFVAFSIIAGVRIAALAVDRHVREASLVDYALGEDPRIVRQPLGEFRIHVVELLQEAEPLEWRDVSAQPSEEELQSLIGLKAMLIAPIFGVSLRQVELRPQGLPIVALVHSTALEPPPSALPWPQSSEEGALRLPLDVLREWLADLVGEELETLQSRSRLSIDLQVLPEAEAALQRGDAETVITILQTWPALLGIMIRTQRLEDLPSVVFKRLARGLRALAEAYRLTSNQDMAEAVLRFGVQWAQAGPVADVLYRSMGELLLAQGRAEEAIGLFRRALTLGGPDGGLYFLIGQSLVASGRYVGGAGALELARAYGYPEQRVRELLDFVDEKTSGAWAAFRAKVPAPALDEALDGAADTEPPGSGVLPGKPGPDTEPPGAKEAVADTEPPGSSDLLHDTEPPDPSALRAEVDPPATLED